MAGVALYPHTLSCLRVFMYSASSLLCHYNVWTVTEWHVGISHWIGRLLDWLGCRSSDWFPSRGPSQPLHTSSLHLQWYLFTGLLLNFLNSLLASSPAPLYFQHVFHTSSQVAHVKIIMIYHASFFLKPSLILVFCRFHLLSFLKWPKIPHPTWPLSPHHSQLPSPHHPLLARWRYRRRSVGACRTALGLVIVWCFKFLVEPTPCIRAQITMWAVHALCCVHTCECVFASMCGVCSLMGCFCLDCVQEGMWCPWGLVLWSWFVVAACSARH